MEWRGVRVTPSSFSITGVAQGTVASGFVSVRIAGTVVSCLAARGLVTAVDDIVYGRRLNGRVLIEGLLWSNASPPATPTPVPDDQAPPPAPEPVTRYGTTIITPVETRSYRPNWGWRTDTDDVYQGEYGNNGNHKGCAFYGTKPRSLSGATVTSATVRFKRVRGSGWISPQHTTLWKITNKTKPSGAPTITGSSTSGPYLAQGASTLSITGGFHIPDSFAQALVDGTAGGLCLYDSSGDPYVRMEGRSGWSSSFMMTIHWKRTS